MPPIKRMKPDEDELIAHIRESLLGHEEAYVPGAWESFNKKEEKKGGFIILMGWLSAAAAVLLIGAGLFIVLKKEEKAGITPQVASSGAAQSHPGAVTTIPGQDHVTQDTQDLKQGQGSATVLATNTHHKDLTAGPGAIGTDLVAEVSSSTYDQSAVNQAQKVQDPVVAGHPALVQEPDVAIAKAGVKEKAVEPERKQPGTFEDFLNNEVRKNDNPERTAKLVNKKADKWEMGVMVAPSFGNTKKLNMGYGVSMGYNLSDKLSLNSGIAYNEMAATKGAGGPPAMANPSAASAFASDAKSLESSETRVVGIDIPLELKYHLSKNFYANVGVSAFAVLNQKQDNTFIQGKVVARAENNLSGDQELKTYFVNQRVTEKVSDPEVKENRYLGFYNFSLGFKQKVSKNKSIAIEPFMKVPMKDITSENLRLMGTGVRLKFDF